MIWVWIGILWGIGIFWLVIFVIDLFGYPILDYIDYSFDNSALILKKKMNILHNSFIDFRIKADLWYLNFKIQLSIIIRDFYEKHSADIELTWNGTTKTFCIPLFVYKIIVKIMDYFFRD